jgi:Carboxypeptidase regulatory-like domain/TonB dependent receptor
MYRKFRLIVVIALLSARYLPAQTTNGLITGTITDSSGAVVPGAQVDVANQAIGLTRTADSDSEGKYILPQLPPGVYDILVKAQGFATQTQRSLQLQVNQNATLDFKLTVSSAAETIEVTGAQAPLNTTSATLSDVIGHSATVDLPLNGRQFTQLTLLTPGAAPIEGSQQSTFTVALGAGGISPTVNGQRPQQNNFTMDGVLNNSLFTNIWAISPPPDALQEFNVQSHITDAQFAITSGANINIVTRSGTNAFHGSVWEFLRNDELDAKTFPATTRNPYRQNQYGVFLGGPVILPRFNGKDNTWFSAYWEGFRSSKSISYLASTFTPAMETGDFSALLGAQVGTDSLGRPEYKNEIYDPATSRPDPNNPGAILRDPFPGNIIPSARINSAATAVLQKYYTVSPNLNVAASVLPNLLFVGNNATSSDQAGIRLDHRFRNNDILFGRYNRLDANLARPEATPGYLNTLLNYAQTYAVGYTHLFGSNTILNVHYGYTNTDVSTTDDPAGAAFNSSINFSEVQPAKYGISLGPMIGFTNGYSGIAQDSSPLGPQHNSDYHGDLSRVIGHHTLGVGGMYYHVHSIADGWTYTISFAQNATSQGALASTTGLGPASFLLGLPDGLSSSLGNTGVNQSINWFGGYFQDQWQTTKNLTITAGLRYDYASPPDNHGKTMSVLDFLTGQFVISAPYAPLFPKATGPSSLFYPQYNGYEPRFGVAYRASSRTVFRSAFALLDDHDNSLVQLYQNARVSWPNSISLSATGLNRGLPATYFDQLPPASSYVSATTPYTGVGVDPHAKIPYSMEYNAGIEQQLSSSIVLTLNYVGSVSRDLFITPTANTAKTPGPGSLASRGQPYPQYGGGVYQFSYDGGSASYNAFQAELKKTLSSGLLFQAAYTWSKALDVGSSGQTGTIQSVYDISQEWGPSTFNLKHIFVLSGAYALPVGRGKDFLPNPNKVIQAVAGNWNIGSIVTLTSGTPFNALAGGDIANVGGGVQRAERIGNANAGFHRSIKEWFNTAAYATPAQYTFGNERRDDLIGPTYKNFDFNTFKNIPLWEWATLQFRAEFFNIFNHTNYGTPSNSTQTPSFGQITGAAGSSREIQFALKLSF